jgi:DNA polymerase-1
MLKNRCTFNELEFRRMAEQFDAILKKGDCSNHNNTVDAKLYKTTTKNEDQFDLLGVLRNDSLMKRAINFIIH